MRLHHLEKERIQTTGNPGIFESEIIQIKSEINKNEKILKDLRKQYEQIMLTKMVRGDKDYELDGWWMNRY